MKLKIDPERIRQQFNQFAEWFLFRLAVLICILICIAIVMTFAWFLWESNF